MRSLLIAWRPRSEGTNHFYEAPISDTTATLSDEETRLILQPSRFRYGFQWIGDRLNVVKCSTRDLLRDPSAFPVIVAWMAKIIAAALGNRLDSDVVVIARDASPFRDELPRLLTALPSDPAFSELDWRGDLYGSMIETTRRRGRQILRHHLNSVVRTATRYAAKKRTVSDQMQLFQDRRPRNGALLVYFDNGAVTGSAIRDVALSAADLIAPCPAQLRILVLINKLAPSEERLLHQIQAMSQAGGGALELGFDALLQLRIPTFESFELTPLARELDGLPAACRGVDLDDVQRWLDDVASFVQRAADRANDHCGQYPMGPASASFTSVSTEAILFRHLLAIHQGGLPVIDAIVHSLHKMWSDDDRSLTVVLALG